MGKRWATWMTSEIKFIEEAISNIKNGSSQYDEAKRLKKFELSHRSVRSIRTHIYLKGKNK